ncbi:MAG: hypothetical protein ACXW2I_05465 [Burkholderiales bacterium]
MVLLDYALIALGVAVVSLLILITRDVRAYARRHSPDFQNRRARKARRAVQQPAPQAHASIDDAFAATNTRL